MQRIETRGVRVSCTMNQGAQPSLASTRGRPRPCAVPFDGCKRREIPPKAPPWPGIKRLGAPGRVRPPPWEDALLRSQDAQRQMYLPHKPRSSIVAGVHPRSDAALCCAGLKVARPAIPRLKPPLGPIRAPLRAGPRPTPLREDALAPSQDAEGQMYLPHKPRGTIVAGVHPEVGRDPRVRLFQGPVRTGNCRDCAETHPAPNNPPPLFRWIWHPSALLDPAAPRLPCPPDRTDPPATDRSPRRSPWDPFTQPERLLAGKNMVNRCLTKTCN